MAIALAALITAIFGLASAWIGYRYAELRHQREMVATELRHQREMGVKMIEIELGILAEKPAENQPLRDWAVDVLAHYSRQAEVPLSEDAKSTLRHHPLPVTTTVFDAAAGRYYLRGGGAVGASGDQSETPLPLRENG